VSKILVTGAAGFIGFHLSVKLLARGDTIVGVDNLNAYYDPALKKARLEQLHKWDGFRFIHLDIADRARMRDLFSAERFERVAHLAAQAGVRYSLQNPFAYADSNLLGFLNVLEGCRQNQVIHLVYASSSSVYGANTVLPFSVKQSVDHPISLYAATKKANELMAHTYSHLYGIPTTGLRFFTVYGPWGRPDMAYFLFTEAILRGEPIEVFNGGSMRRDFTYIDDIVEGVVRTLDHVAIPDANWSSEEPNPSSSSAPYRLYNIGNHTPIELVEFIATIEAAVGRRANIRFKGMQPGDVTNTFADVEELQRDVGFAPATTLEHGIARFVEWYRNYYGV